MRKLSALEKDLSKTFVKKLSTVYSKCILRVQRIIAMRILLLAGMSNSFLRGRTNFSNFFRKSFHSQSCFRNLSINIADSYQKVFGSFVKLHSTCQEKNFEVFFYWKICNLVFFSNLSTKFSDLRQNFPGEL